MESKPRLLGLLDAFSLLLLLIASGMVFFYAPTERVMGAVQKVFYFHVAAGWVGMLSFLVAAIAGVLYLRTVDPKWDLLGLSAVEIGIVFALINILSGSIWARPTWNTWWTWDPRLTTAAIMELIYAAYWILRLGIEDPARRARFAAVYAVLGFASVPLTFLSARLFRTIHPIVIATGQASASSAFETPAMLHTFLFSILAFSVVFIDLLWHRLRLGRLSELVEQLKMRRLE